MILMRHGQSEFNAVYGKTRTDPGIADAPLTAEGRRQARAAAEALKGHGIGSLLASPYSRTLETAEIIAAYLGLPIAVEPLVRERVYFACDVGTPRAALAARWPALDFAALDEVWWSAAEESEAVLRARCARFVGHAAARDDWRQILVVTHYGFIKELTGAPVENAMLVGFDPTRRMVGSVV